MSIVLNRPYRFVPPHRGNWWPSFIQRFRIVDHYLRIKEGVHSFECRNLEAFQQALSNEKGILLTPNHCRYADPLAMGWPARLAKTHVYAMASWHLFNKSWLDGFAIRKMGGFSIHREASDRQALETAIEILASGERPLILFPEGTTSRMNDSLKELLDGVAFIARAAARKSAKATGRCVVMLPIAIKYLCKVDYRPWGNTQAAQLEDHLGIRRGDSNCLIDRVQRLVEHWIAKQERNVFGDVRTGGTRERRVQLANELLIQIQDQLDLQNDAQQFSDRIRSVRSQISTKRFSEKSADLETLASASKMALLSQELMTFNDDYLTSEAVTDTRVIETIQRLQESCYGQAKQNIPLHAVMQFGDEIQVPSKKAQRDQPDPLLDQIRTQLKTMLSALSQEANIIGSDLS